MENKKGKKKSAPDFIDKFFVPKGITDPVLVTVLQSAATTIFFAIILMSGVTIWVVQLDAPISRMLLFIFISLAAISLVVLRLGFHTMARFIYFTNLCTTLVLSAQVLGQDSFMWVYFLQIPSGTLFMTVPSEKRFRIFCHITAAAGLLTTYLLFHFNVVSPEINPEYHRAMAILGVVNICFAALLLLVYVLRYQREVVMYKASLEQQSVAMLQQAKMSTLGEMAAGVAHEINNPLGVIIGKIEVLENRIGQNQVDAVRLIQDFSKMKVVVQRIAKIVAALRTYARNAENDPFVPARLDEILAETLDLWSENLRIHNIQIRVKGEKGIQFESRPVQISQVLANMISNAYDAIQNLPEKWIEIHSEKIDTQKFRISITDSGSGIPEKVAEKIMQPFFTTKEIGKGTGLGLSVSKGIVENHHGSISLDRSSPHTCFVIELPFRQNLGKENEYVA